MKKLRLGCLLFALALLVTRPAVVRADADECCARGHDWCNLTICADHGGALLCNIHIGMGCSDLCFCSDGYYVSDGSVGALCTPCAG